MKTKISSRDIKFFILGLFIMLITVIIWDWDSFMKGVKDARNDRPFNPTIESNE